MSEYKSAFFIVPSRILELPDLQLSYLRVYETIFQFWNHGKQCYLKNNVIMERAGIKSDSTLNDAFTFFEKHNELKRVYKGVKRYLVQPEQKIEIENKAGDNSKDDSSKNSQGLDLARGGSRLSERQGLDLARHNIKKLNKEIKKESSVDLYLYPDDFFPDDKRRELLSIVAKKTNNTEVYLLDKFAKVSKEYETKSDDWQLTFEKFLNREKPKRVYEDQKGQVRRYDNQPRY